MRSAKRFIPTDVSSDMKEKIDMEIKYWNLKQEENLTNNDGEQNSINQLK